MPPGGTFDPMQFIGLTIGNSYRISFVASSSTGYGTMFFRPGILGVDTPIDSDGAKSIDFTAQDANGVTRFLHTDVTGVTQIGISALKLVAL